MAFDDTDKLHSCGKDDDFTG